MDEKKKLLLTQAADLMKTDREAFAEMIVEYVNPNHISSDLVDQIMDSRALQPGDSLVKKVRKGITVRTLVPGAIHLASEITVQERMTYNLDGADVKVRYSEWDIENGNIGTVADIESEMLAKLRDYYYNKVFTALSTIWTAGNTPSNYASAGGSVTATLLEAAIDRINQTTPGVRAVIGVRKALTPITKFGAFWDDGNSTVEGVPSQLEAVLRDGWLGRYYGAPIIALDQIYDYPDTNTALLPEDKIVVIGNKAGEFITYGDVKRKQWVNNDPTPPDWMLEIYQQFGMIIDNAEGIYVIGNIS